MATMGEKSSLTVALCKGLPCSPKKVFYEMLHGFADPVPAVAKSKDFPPTEFEADGFKGMAGKKATLRFKSGSETAYATVYISSVDDRSVRIRPSHTLKM